MTPDLARSLAVRKTKTPQEIRAAKELRRKRKRYQNVCDQALPANYDLERAAELAGVSWQTVIRWIGDSEFADLWAAQRVRLSERLMGTAVEMALGSTKKVETDEGEVVVETRAPDSSMVRHLQGAMDPRFQKTTKVAVQGTLDVTLHSAMGGMSEEELNAEIARLAGKRMQAEAVDAEFEEVDGSE